MPDIPFTQYLLPDGRKEARTVEVSDEIAAMAQKFIAAGGAYTCEMLRTGEVSLAAEYTVDGERMDIACTVCLNGVLVTEAVDDIVRESVNFIEKKS